MKKNKNSSGNEIANVNFLRPHDTILQNIIRIVEYSTRRRPWRSGVAKGGGGLGVYCGQTAGWINMVLGMEVCLSPGDFMLDGDPASLPKKGQSPALQFSAHFYCG